MLRGALNDSRRCAIILCLFCFFLFSNVISARKSVIQDAHKDRVLDEVNELFKDELEDVGAEAYHAPSIIVNSKRNPHDNSVHIKKQVILKRPCTYTTKQLTVTFTKKYYTTLYPDPLVVITQTDHTSTATIQMTHTEQPAITCLKTTKNIVFDYARVTKNIGKTTTLQVLHQNTQTCTQVITSIMVETLVQDDCATQET